MMDMIIRYRNNMNLLGTTRFGQSRNKFLDAQMVYNREAQNKIELGKANISIDLSIWRGFTIFTSLRSQGY